MTAPAGPIRWPGGARAAVSFSFDMDADALIHIARPDDAAHRVSTTSFLRYGPEVAVPRICDLFESLGLSATFFVPGWCAEEHAGAIARMIEGGHEIAHHGYLHESPNLNTREREAYWTARALDALERAAGVRPRGYRAPLYAFSRHTAAILAELGLAYDSSLMGDDRPYLIASGAGRLLELPVHWACDDWVQFAHLADIDYVMAIQPARRAFEVYRAEFEGALAGGGLWQVVWHPFLIGRPARLLELARLLEEIRARGDVWIARAGAVADHVLGLIESGAYAPRIDDLPAGRAPL